MVVKFEVTSAGKVKITSDPASDSIDFNGSTARIVSSVGNMNIEIVPHSTDAINYGKVVIRSTNGTPTITGGESGKPLDIQGNFDDESIRFLDASGDVMAWFCPTDDNFRVNLEQQIYNEKPLSFINNIPGTAGSIKAGTGTLLIYGYDDISLLPNLTGKVNIGGTTPTIQATPEKGLIIKTSSTLFAGPNIRIDPTSNGAPGFVEIGGQGIRGTAIGLAISTTSGVGTHYIHLSPNGDPNYVALGGFAGNTYAKFNSTGIVEMGGATPNIQAIAGKPLTLSTLNTNKNINLNPHGTGQVISSKSTDCTGGSGNWFRPPQMTTAQANTMTTGWGASDAGKMWFDTTTKQMMMWDGTQQVILG